MLASIRPDSWTLPLFLHVLGAMVLVGGLLVTTTSALVARGDGRLLRIGYMTLVTVCLPAFVVMRLAAQWIASKEQLDGSDAPTWVGIGFMTADAGFVLLLIALILGGIGVRRLRNGRTGLVRASLFISVVMLAAYIVTIWAMGAKPA